MYNHLNGSKQITNFELDYHCYTSLPNPSTRAGYDTRSIFLAEFNRFEFRVFLFLD